ncbi:hypothetical protein BDN71DRAFT_1224589 [Pleurotus eryngii]|uniref:Uncharacterized protein n=1 Tax=Pleurotus eryngii TaxID=5323 RepID=A0A9P5ZS76_PLEER|nr:hypothetical protein BDN71DRAFT_1224589 [Pleurotus eryngii]
MGDSTYTSRTPRRSYVTLRTTQHGNDTGTSARTPITISDSESDADELPPPPRVTEPSTPSSGRTTKSAADPDAFRAKLFSPVSRRKTDDDVEMAHDLRADVGGGSSSTRIAHNRSVKRSQTLPTVPLSRSKPTVAHLSTPSALKGRSWGSSKSVRADSDEERVPVTPSTGRTTSSAGEPASIRANLFPSVPAKRCVLAITFDEEHGQKAI